MRFKLKTVFPALLSSLVLLSACNQTSQLSQSDSTDGSSTNSISTSSDAGTIAKSSPTPARHPASGSPTPSATPTSTPVEETGKYPSCVRSDVNHICIGLKMVSYQSTIGVPVISEPDSITLVTGINKLWDTCNINFQLEQYQGVDPTTKGLTYNVNWQSDGDTVRKVFKAVNQFLVVAVGTLSGSTIGVTEMPGVGIYGSLIENAYAKNPMTVGHELGHYLGLYHVSDTSNLMSAYIGNHTEALTTSQCTTARSTFQKSWTAMKRSVL